MRKAQVVAIGALVAGLAAGTAFAWHRRNLRQVTAVVRAAVPPIPDLATWPREYAARVRGATAAASRLEQPLKALSELACLYHANALYREAQQAEHRLHTLEPKNAQWAYYLADTCQNLGDMDGTRTFLEETLRLAPHYPVTRLKLADLCFKLGLTDDAFRQYEWRLTLAPNDPYALLGLARIAEQRGNRAEALRLFKIIVRTSLGFPSAHSLLAEFYAQGGDQARADEERRLGSAAGRFIEANDPFLYRVYAWSFDPYRLDAQGGSRLQVRQLEASLPFYEKAARLAPRDSSVCDALGNVYLQLSRLDEARTALEAGVAEAPATPALYSTLAQVLLAAGRKTDARKTIERGLIAAQKAGDTELVARFEQLLRQQQP
jgi:tetratricopeptide (TPR) repeat protein